MSTPARESYKTAGFAEFYDAMIEALPPEFEAGRDVQHVYWPLLTELAAAAAKGGSASPASGSAAAGGRRPANTVVLDLCCGSGRVALALAAKWAAWGGRPAGAALVMAGVDSSEEMLAAARAKQVAQAGADGSTGKDGATASIGWRCAHMAALGANPALAALRRQCSLAVVSAGSFHHLLTSADQAACLRGLAACLQPAPAPAFVVLNIFNPAHLQAAPGEPVVVGPFRRTCLSQAREAAPDGGAVWRQRFLLERYASGAAAAGAAGAAAAEEGNDSGARSSGGSDSGASEAPLWQREEEWALREVRPAELERLAAEAGLQVVWRQARWSDGWPGMSSIGQGGACGCRLEDARIFVLRLAA
ncbi:hypothetical protein ABPG75_006099 [Micractinium tetrahymenae]